MSSVKRPSSSSTPSTTALPDRRSRTPGSIVTVPTWRLPSGLRRNLPSGPMRKVSTCSGPVPPITALTSSRKSPSSRKRSAPNGLGTPACRASCTRPDDAGLGADEDPQVDRAGERADELDLGGHGTCQRELTAAAAGGELDLDEPDEGQRPDLQLGLDRDDDVDLAVGVGRRIAAAVEARPRLEDLDRCRLTRLQQRVEGLRDLEDLVLERGVEHHRDAAAGGEQAADAGQAETG